MEKYKDLREKFINLLSEWEARGKPSRTDFHTSAEEIIDWKEKNRISGLWEVPPLFVTATIDDGWGHGLQLIHLWAQAVGLKVHRLGLLKRPEEIIRACLQLHPDFLGMTVLQLDSEDDLLLITQNLPSKTRVIAGGPAFTADPAMGERTGVHFVAKNAAEFLSFMLKIDELVKSQT